MYFATLALDNHVIDNIMINKKGHKKLTKTLKDIIAESGLKQYVIADRANISENFLSRMVTGDRRPSPQTARKLAKVLDCGVEDIFFAINKHSADK